MSTTELFAAVAVPAPRWRGGGEVEADAEIAAYEEDVDGSSDADWHSGKRWSSTLRSSLSDPYGQQFRPHLFGM